VLAAVCCLQIHFEDFRMFSESFGMQLDDDSLLALYYVHDPDGRSVRGNRVSTQHMWRRVSAHSILHRLARSCRTARSALC
jgi:predicted secreted hydrolase